MPLRPDVMVGTFVQKRKKMIEKQVKASTYKKKLCMKQFQVVHQKNAWYSFNKS